MRAREQRLRRLINTRDSARHWRQRVRDVLECPDIALLPRHPQAGQIVGHDQIMHNGLRVALGTYYTSHMNQLLQHSRGVHEPQEERIFAEVLQQMPADATMLELGAYWSFYSMWFKQIVPGGRNILVEPDKANLTAGRLNFSLNKFDGEFFNAYLGERYRHNPYDAPTVSVDWLAEKFGLTHLNLLHSDIQGYELQMLKGAGKMLRERRVDYIFVSTHSEELHDNCRAFLEKHDYPIIADHNLAESYSVDGLLVARRKELQGLKHITLSKKSS